MSNLPDNCSQCTISHVKMFLFLSLILHFSWNLCQFREKSLHVYVCVLYILPFIVSVVITIWIELVWNRMLFEYRVLYTDL